jgi:hypothetical protein
MLVPVGSISVGPELKYRLGEAMSGLLLFAPFAPGNCRIVPQIGDHSGRSV